MIQIKSREPSHIILSHNKILWESNVNQYTICKWQVLSTLRALSRSCQGMEERLTSPRSWFRKSECLEGDWWGREIQSDHVMQRGQHDYKARTHDRAHEGEETQDAKISPHSNPSSPFTIWSHFSPYLD